MNVKIYGQFLIADTRDLFPGEQTNITRTVLGSLRRATTTYRYAPVMRRWPLVAPAVRCARRRRAVASNAGHELRGAKKGTPKLVWRLN